MKVGTRVLVHGREKTGIAEIVSETKTQWIAVVLRIRVFENGDVDLTTTENRIRFSKRTMSVVGSCDGYLRTFVSEPDREQLQRTIDQHHVRGMAHFLATRRWDKMSKESLKLVMLIVKEHTK